MKSNYIIVYRYPHYIYISWYITQLSYAKFPFKYLLMFPSKTSSDFAIMGWSGACSRWVASASAPCALAWLAWGEGYSIGISIWNGYYKWVYKLFTRWVGYTPRFIILIMVPFVSLVSCVSWFCDSYHHLVLSLSWSFCSCFHQYRYCYRYSHFWLSCCSCHAHYHYSICC